MTIIFAMILFGTIAYQIETSPPKKFDCFRDPACDQHRPKYVPKKHKTLHPKTREDRRK